MIMVIKIGKVKRKEMGHFVQKKPKGSKTSIAIHGLLGYKFPQLVGLSHVRLFAGLTQPFIQLHSY